MKDLISVIVPVYNTGQYLQKCIASILAQDYPNLEILLIDDGSKDTYTIQLCDQFAAKYVNVTTYHKSNGGSASARNYGIKRAKGRYIGFIDSDDIIESDMFSTLYFDLTANGVKVAIGGIATDEKGKIIDRIAPVATGVYEYTILMHHFMLGSFHSACTNLYDSSLFAETLFPENEVNEDYMLNYWIFRKLDRVSVNEKTLYHYIRRDDSNTSSPASLKFLDWLKHTKLILDEMKGDTNLVGEAEYQYLYSNIILANKSLLTLGNMKSDDAVSLYKISTENLRKDRDMVHRSTFLGGRHQKMALWMIRCPHIYKWSIITALKIKKLIR